ncbi:tetratricopeptide repeat protein [Burkholderia plantarii]|uniref:Uncharacterized protein n=1 Tax=Burkholderia plantarii TaxID=41899 RepID=A0A0B6RW86_BURPL|nr:tetratricopeptide repeat protein [Burkholderia plantarii]AJK45300.1 hypothetical protein BGL_1c07660 [Burkholderia plantarii]
MNWQHWANQLRQYPEQAVGDLLGGMADITPFERLEPREFLLAVLPRVSRLVPRTLLGEPVSSTPNPDPNADLPALVDAGLSRWLLARRQAALPTARKLGAYVAQLCEVLQLPLYFALPQTLSVLQAERRSWLQYLSSLTLSPYRDPEYDYWQALAAQQSDDRLQFFWQSFIVEAGRLRSRRYLNLGLLALARLPLSEDDSLRNLRLQVQALINRYARRKVWGTTAIEELADSLRGVMVRNPSLSADSYRSFLTALISPLGDDKTSSVFSLLGLGRPAQQYGIPKASSIYKVKLPGNTEDTDRAVQAVSRSSSLAQAWNAIHHLLTANADYLHKTGDPYHFLRTLDRCARTLCGKYALRDPEVQGQLFQWIHLALRMDSEDPRRWMLWELALRRAGQPQRAQWVLWEMTRRFPDNLQCRVELAQILAFSGADDDQFQAQRLLKQALLLDPENLHAHTTLAKLARERRDWDKALKHAREASRIDPSDAPNTLVMASVYARRNEPLDLQTAIEELQRFVSRYPSSPKIEGYLQNLLRRQQGNDQYTVLEEKEEATDSSTTPEIDPVWRAFADSLRPGSTSSDTLSTTAIDGDRVLPLPQALQLAVAQSRWDDNLLDSYDAETQQEFQLEVLLWRYLQTLRSASSSPVAYARARQMMQTWLDNEQRSSQNDPSWLAYLGLHWRAVSSATSSAITEGAEWLTELVERHRPLPAPLLN